MGDFFFQANLMSCLVNSGRVKRTPCRMHPYAWRQRRWRAEFAKTWSWSTMWHQLQVMDDPTSLLVNWSKFGGFIQIGIHIWIIHIDSSGSIQIGIFTPTETTFEAKKHNSPLGVSFNWMGKKQHRQLDISVVVSNTFYFQHDLWGNDPHFDLGIFFIHRGKTTN